MKHPWLPVALLLGWPISLASTPGSPPATHEPNEQPIVIAVREPAKSQGELAQEAADRAERQAADESSASTNGWLIRIGVFQGVIFALQLVAFIAQAMKLNETVRISRAQSDDVRHSVEHAARGASAMEAVADAMAANTRNSSALLELQKMVFSKQSRAYLIPLFGTHIHENKEKDFKHEVRVIIKNGGNTPAHAIRCVFRVKVLPVPLSADVDLGLPDISSAAVESYGLLASQDTFYVRAWLGDFLSDQENEAIKRQQASALYAFGMIRYKDMFDEERYTEFCRVIQWDEAGKPNWVSIPGHNNAT